ncbi:cysteine peptidase family C39 domain-containing protein, partial [Sphingobacterium sp. HSC-15S19]|uniref:cysteine peptidase family C39 domain-containing protein n=1 Tax=Sphingobacterium sp. HSC-15S19 TaxID=2910971 RepID=UPI003D1FA030
MKNLKLLYDLLVRTNNPVECGIACIQTVAKYYGYLCSIDELKHTSRMSESGMTLLELSKIAKNIGFSAKAYRTDFETIIGIDSPLVLNTISKSGQNGYVVMLGTTENVIGKSEYTTFGNLECSKNGTNGAAFLAIRNA